jgi:hypothetical protein
MTDFRQRKTGFRPAGEKRAKIFPFCIVIASKQHISVKLGAEL